MDMRDKLLDYSREFDNDDRYETSHQIEMLVIRRDKLEKALSAFARENLGNMCFENDGEVIEYFLSFN